MKAIATLSLFAVATYFSSCAMAVSMCGYTVGDNIDLSEKANNFDSGGCCKVDGIDQDVGTGKWEMRVRCSNCFQHALFDMRGDVISTFDSCKELRLFLK
jgi:hypothetical protein